MLGSYNCVINVPTVCSSYNVLVLEVPQAPDGYGLMMVLVVVVIGGVGIVAEVVVVDTVVVIDVVHSPALGTLP